SRYTSLLGVGYAHVTEAGSNYVKDANAAFLAPDQLRGIRIFLGGDQSKTWPILSNDTKKVTVDVTTNALTASVGQIFRGLFRFDALTVHNQKVDTTDFIVAGNAIDPASVFQGNLAPPAVNTALIGAATSGSGVIGQPGAVSDPDLPITIR